MQIVIGTSVIDLLNQRLSAGTRLRQREVLHILPLLGYTIGIVTSRSVQLNLFITDTFEEQNFSCTQTVHLGPGLYYYIIYDAQFVCLIQKKRT